MGAPKGVLLFLCSMALWNLDKNVSSVRAWKMARKLPMIAWKARWVVSRRHLAATSVTGLM